MIESINPVLAKRSCGVFLHLSSLDGSCAIGDLGAKAYEFASWCSSAGFSWWQMLPVGPLGPGNSPYSSTSSFAGEPLFISLESLANDGLLSSKDVRESLAVTRKFARRSNRPGSHSQTDYDTARLAKEPAFLRAFENFRLGGGFRSPSFRAFEKREYVWLKGWRTFTNDTNGYHAFLQFVFDKQWTALRKTCAANGVKLLGDIPMFVTLESADVMSNPKLFRLDRKGRPEVLTGVPPDCFSKDGQLWGHPHYRWSAHRTQKFRWWTQRIASSLRRFDGVRIDHFVGFHHAYEIPAGARNARRGQWRLQAGKELLTAATRSLGALPLVAEDLGAVTPEVVALRKSFNLPGMKVLHHAFGHDNSGELPHHHDRDCVVYPATHDNDTTRGWWKSLSAPSRKRFVRFAGSTAAHQPNEAMIRIAFESPAQLAMISLQDILGLDRSARMNFPGTPKGNWCWRLGTDWHARRIACAKSIYSLAALTGRNG
ncbi:MAG: 4-alpha-glucanotransferase [Planctomycetota bacterium]|nr:4-alpha-glucanotransferase [Planctomycetota bacterium]MDA1261480.1 4-alpha-glucanotransferase [Planctomycetota bacterium]